MIESNRVPWPMWVFSAITIVGIIVIEVEADAPIAAKALFAAVMAVWLYFLLKGMRWVWILTVIIGILSVASQLISGSLTLADTVLGLVGLLLLLLPDTRRYFSSQTNASKTDVDT